MYLLEAESKSSYQQSTLVNLNQSSYM